MDSDQLPADIIPAPAATIEGDSKGETLAAVQSLDYPQQTYLGAIRQKRRQSLALKIANVDPPTLERWRSDPLFRALEDSIKAKAWGIGKALARDTAEAHAHEHVLALHSLAFNRDPETGERMQTPILSRSRDGVVTVVGHTDAVSPGERIKASARLLEASGTIGQAAQQATGPITINAGQMVLLVQQAMAQAQGDKSEK